MALKETDTPGRDYHTDTEAGKCEADFRNTKSLLRQYRTGKLSGTVIR